MDGACVVVDLGTGFVKAELASAEAPKTYQNIVGTPKHKPLLKDTRTTADGLVVSGDAVQQRGVLRVSYPMVHGHVKDHNAVNNVLKYVVGDLGVPPKDHPMLLTEAPLSSRLQRAKLAEYVFEELQHPALLFSVQAVLSLFSSGQTTGVVLDVGDGVTHACPVFDGYSIRDATRRVDFGGRDVTTYLQTLLRQHGHTFDTSAEFEMVRDIKEKLCSTVLVARNKDDVDVPLQKHHLPDGTEIELGRELQLAPELLFDPTLNGHECPSVVDVCCESIKACDIDLRRPLYSSIFLAGGTTHLTKFGDRFLSETARRTPRSCTVRVHAPAERHHTTWIGGSFLAQLSTFKDMLTTKAEYAEQGERVLHSRLFA